MQKFLMLSIGTLALGACSGERQTSDDTSRDTDVEPAECTEDEACGAYEICVANACVVGDRDDTLAEAGPIFKVSGVDDPNVSKGMIHAPGDVDHYAYTATGAEWLRVWTITDDSNTDGLDTVLSVYAPDGSLHHVMDEFGTGGVSTYDSLMNVYLPSAGTWTFKVEDKGTYYAEEVERGSETFTYELGIESWSSVSTEADSAESPALTFSLANGTTIYPWGVVIDEAGDIDWTQASMPYGDAPFEIWAPGDIPGSPLRTRVTVTDAEGNAVLMKDDVGPEGIAAYFDGYETTWTLAVSDADGGGGADYWTVLYLRTRPEGYGNPREEEPNDSPDTATVLDQEEFEDGDLVTDRAYLQGRFLEGDPVDHYKLEVVPGGSLRVACGSDRYGAYGDVELAVLDAEGVLVTSASDGDDKAPDIEGYTVEAGGTYTLAFTEKTGLSGVGVYYRCGVYVDHP